MKNNEIDFENVGTDSKVNYFDFFSLFMWPSQLCAPNEMLDPAIYSGRKSIQWTMVHKYLATYALKDAVCLNSIYQ